MHRLTRLTGTLQDITKRKETKEALTDGCDLPDRVMATSAMVIAAVDAAGLVVFANDRAASLLCGAEAVNEGPVIETVCTYFCDRASSEIPDASPQD